MTEYRTIDLDTYPRRAHLEYFISLQQPHFSLTADVDVTDLRAYCREKGCSFFLSFLHAVALAADDVPQLRQRIHLFTREERERAAAEGTVLPEWEIREYSESPTSHTESTGDGLYCYCTLKHHMPWEEYIRSAAELQKKAREAASLEEDEEVEAYYFPTCIPWIRYTEAVHPMADRYDSNPRFSWGKFEEDFRGRLMMPLTIAAHHGLVDGLHAAQFYENVRRYMEAIVREENI